MIVERWSQPLILKAKAKELLYFSKRKIVLKREKNKCIKWKTTKCIHSKNKWIPTANTWRSPMPSQVYIYKNVKMTWSVVWNRYFYRLSIILSVFYSPKHIPNECIYIFLDICHPQNFRRFFPVNYENEITKNHKNKFHFTAGKRC